MEKLMKPVEYAEKLGISRQAVYAKVKRGILSAKNVEGKLYIVVDSTEDKTTPAEKKEVTVKPKVVADTKTEIKDYKALLQAKDETISVLKGTVKDLKKSNKQISTTLRGEIDLLKDAFHEMRSLYVLQLKQKSSQDDTIDVVDEGSVEVEIEKWIGLKKFFKIYEVHKEKQQEKVIKCLKKAFEKSDERLMNVEGKLKLNANKNYEDIIK